MTVGEVSKNLPWVEKYRPSKLEDLVSHDDIIQTISKFMKENQLPHLLFYGPPGTGKTSTILACAKQMYTPQQFNSMSSICNRYLGGGGASCGSTQGAEVSAAQWADARAPRPAPLQLCDVAGAALATDMLPNYLYASDIVIFVYDLTNLQSFEKLDTWMKSIKDIFESEPKKPLMALFGNKSDLEHQRAVRLSCVQKFSSEHLLENFKGSARTGEMVNTAFSKLIARVLGVKMPVEIAAHRKSTDTQISEMNGQPPLPSNDATNTLIMNRKMLRKIQRKSSSSVCCVQ